MESSKHQAHKLQRSPKIQTPKTKVDFSSLLLAAARAGGGTIGVLVGQRFDVIVFAANAHHRTAGKKNGQKRDYRGPANESHQWKPATDFCQHGKIGYAAVFALEIEDAGRVVGFGQARALRGCHRRNVVDVFLALVTEAPGVVAAHLVPVLGTGVFGFPERRIWRHDMSSFELLKIRILPSFWQGEDARRWLAALRAKVFIFVAEFTQGSPKTGNPGLRDTTPLALLRCVVTSEKSIDLSEKVF